MRASLIPRARIALAAAISATILAIGICMASTPATAQAVTVSDGAAIVSPVPDGPAKTIKGKTFEVDVIEENHNYYLSFKCDGDEVYVDYVGDYDDTTYKEVISIPCRCIALKNGELFFEIMNYEYFNPYTIDYERGLGYQDCLLYGNGLVDKQRELIKVSGNTMTVRYAHYNSNGIFKYKSSRTVVYDYKFVYDKSKQRMKRDSKIATVAKKTTTWRTLAKSRTAYKSSTSSKKKFTISKGSKVQVKKVYSVNNIDGDEYFPKGRYYVKTKSGKYGWISAGNLYYD